VTVPGGLRRAAVLPIYPFFVAAYPVVFLYAQNLTEAISPSEIVMPLAISLAATVAALLLFRAVSRQWAAAALMSTLLLVLFFSYGIAWDQLGPKLPSHWVLLSVWLVLAVIGLLLIWRFRAHCARVNLPLNAAASIALTVNFVLIGAFVLNARPTAANSSPGITAGRGQGNPTARPDIYWIILEEYGSQSVLRDDFNYDNSPFLDALRQRGFYIADDSTANYLKTAPSIQSARNLQYLDGPALRAQAKSANDWGPLWAELKSPFEVQQFLNNLGYSFIYAGTFWSPMGMHPSAAINYVYTRLTSEFVGVLERGTVLRALEELIPDLPLDPRRNLYDQTVYELRSLERASTLPGPKFIHAQLALDHKPFVFHADGSFLPDSAARARTDEQNYVDELKYTNKRMLAWVDELLDVPEERRPIIVLLADEGPWPDSYRSNEFSFDWTSATPAELREKFGILNAIYLPGKKAEDAGFYPSISPVNEFRVLFNAYFGLDLPILPDRNYIWKNASDWYTFIDATDKLDE
jgi:hypothetical protein